MSEENGGTAFAASGHPGQQFVAQEGMTLRDYFAAKAMMAWAENYDRETAARWAYEMADAMLRARGQ